ncbi:ATP-binding protein [Desulfotomaculum defluvii]
MSEILYQNHFTYFAPAARLPKDKILEQAKIVQKIYDVHSIFDAFPNVILILNQYRQIVYCNDALIDSFKVEDSEKVLGARTGEVLHCIHAFENEAGCGTTEHCTTCGAVLATLVGLAGAKASRECQAVVERQGQCVSLDLLFTAKPLALDGQQFTIVFVTDISHEKRRKSLERIFFHDILNTAGSLRGIVELLSSTKDSAKAKEMMQDLEEIAGGLIEEILAQRDLLSAENNELKVSPEPFDPVELLVSIVEQYAKHPVAQGMQLELVNVPEEVTLVSDPLLLKRVLGNMLKNALEASQQGDVIGLGVDQIDNEVHFWVNNPGEMSRETQLQIFKRSFSTKGSGRGLGTYSMKLITERYLKGSISFVVEEGKGTTFLARYPQNIRV